MAGRGLYGNSLFFSCWLFLTEALRKTSLAVWLAFTSCQLRTVSFDLVFGLLHIGQKWQNNLSLLVWPDSNSFVKWCMEICKKVFDFDHFNYVKKNELSRNFIFFKVFVVRLYHCRDLLPNYHSTTPKILQFRFYLLKINYW